MRLLHTMLRVAHLEKSLNFYTEMLGMQELRRIDNKDYQYTLSFIGYSDEAHHTVLELTHNWGEHTYELGTSYGHIAIECEDIYAVCKKIQLSGFVVSREPGPVLGGTVEIAFVKDPDGYSIELIQKTNTQKF
ncbi:UNVERIFIED_CONTAM: hypothetical protein GTU68_062091 [Idotea baltica]|nr:hypothetical protein [Idotea baltica]